MTFYHDKRDGTVEGTKGDDKIDGGYRGDPEGDRVDANDAILPGQTGNEDLIYAYGGNDTVDAGCDDDTVYGGSGDDTINGQQGDDVLYGDTGGKGAASVRESFEWDKAPDPGCYGSEIDNGDTMKWFTQDTGQVNVKFTYCENNWRVDSEYSTVHQNTSDIVSDGKPVDKDSSLFSETKGKGNGADYTLDFSQEVSNISFRVNDIDGDGVVKVSAYDAQGNLVDVDIEGGSGLTLKDTDGQFGADTADSNGGYLNADSSGYSMLVSVPGPVAKLVIEHDQDGHDNSGIHVTDVYFDVAEDDGGDGDDVISGGTGDDEIFGEGGDDVLNGDEGDDTIYGGDGDDTITGGDGADKLYGGEEDEDVFFGGNEGDEVYGGSGVNTDNDTLNLTGSGVDRIEYTSADREDGIVTFLDGKTMSFEEIENVIPCFTPGTTIATPRGERLVEDLREGDRIITRDNGIQEIRWTGAKTMRGGELVRTPHLKPILIKAGALGNGLPERDMLVSPNHRVLVSNDKTQIYFEEREVLAAAKHLVGTPGIHAVDVMATTYIHFMFDRHEVVLSNGAWTESFQPGDYSLKGVGEAQRDEILELFPELKSRQGIEGYQAARKSLKRHEARLLVD